MPFEPAIVIDGLTVVLGGERRLDGASLTVETGSMHGLLGPNGAGKSTLLRVLYRAQAPTRGTVRVQGRPIDDIPRGTWVRTLGALVQDGGTLQGLTVRDVIDIGLMGQGLSSSERAARTEAALAVTGLMQLADQQAALISGGERQKTHIAQLLARDPAIYVLDEPANHLDLRYQLLLMDEVRRKARTVIATFHDIGLAARYCDTVTVLDGGRVYASGPPQEILSETLFADVFGIEAHLEGNNVIVAGASRP